MLSTPTGDIELPAAHRREMGLRVESEGGLAVVLSSRGGDCGTPDSYVLSVVDMDTRAVLWTRESNGHAAFRLHEGALFLQTWDARRVLEETRSFEDARRDASQSLPSGFGVDMGPLDFNPYC